MLQMTHVLFPGQRDRIYLKEGEDDGQNRVRVFSFSDKKRAFFGQECTYIHNIQHVKADETGEKYISHNTLF